MAELTITAGTLTGLGPTRSADRRLAIFLTMRTTTMGTPMGTSSWEDQHLRRHAQHRAAARPTDELMATLDFHIYRHPRPVEPSTASRLSHTLKP